MGTRISREWFKILQGIKKRRALALDDGPEDWKKEEVLGIADRGFPPSPFLSLRFSIRSIDYVNG
jgi:hypothetical protein